MVATGRYILNTGSISCHRSRVCYRCFAVLPIKIIVKLVINGIIGAAALFAINVFSGLTGLSIGINPITALIAGFLGIPGIILLLFLQYIL